MKSINLNIRESLNEAQMEAIKFRLGLLASTGLMQFCIKTNSCIAGGFWRSAFDGSSISDIDVFCPTADGIEQIIRGLTHDMPDCSVLFRCPKGELVTLKHEYAPKIQLIHKPGITDHWETLTECFDFSCCQMVTEPDCRWLHVGDTSIEDASEKKLTYVGSEWPANTLWRTYKYARKGYQIDNESLVQIVTDIRNLEEIPTQFYVGGID